ncbi:BMP family lipoprotein [Streptomyces alkaliterrae]|uniref:BMP family ABC transporter substrate-binding protein n=1 Tax=Streptomyces alkaliterrae TaxID=2213162 RepID=A0A5P0YP16_9ACTN|nr:BMP family ABC transporter substrate-binding protein [Streptomyces alkaliterrae]MBB1252264.1 BMP family ABC transporter substrate-binding protein [Streptomyces alkaliterrae]MBB1257948.1 BMP family ABC transporter substrate-binding protein [Streptomyces alkaliterrae]MQS01172.1 BMP family ABC transporter substrate-binding protein [Streptomyces alkaliterrae]
MRRVTKLAAAVTATAALALTTAACGNSSSTGSGSSDDKGAAIAYDVGGRGDQSFNDAAYTGLERAKKEFGFKGADQEPSDGEADADKVNRLNELARQGYNPVIGVGFAYAHAVKEAAERNPKTTFGLVDDATVEGDNIVNMVFSEEQGSYLAGVAAAKATESKVVGFVGGVEIPLIKKFEAGFVQGVQDTDKSVKVRRQYLSQPPNFDGFTKPDLGKEAANGQLDANADVIYHAAGLAGQGVIEAVAAKDKWVIGVDSDQYEQKALAKYKDNILTSMTKGVADAVYDLIKNVQEDNVKGGVLRYDLEGDGVALANSNPEFQNMKDIQDAVKKAREGIIAGDIKVNTTP